MAVFTGQPARLWSGAAGGFQVRLFRRAFDLRALPRRATLELFAEQRYHAWINGVCLGRGPAFHHPDQFPVDAFDDALVSNLTVGRNVIAVLVQAGAHSMHNRVFNGEPGLLAQLTLTDAQGTTQHIVSDEQWRVTDQTGWRTQSVRRSWAVDWVERFDQANAPVDWQAVEFDDSAWRTPETHRPGTRISGATFLPRPVPNLQAEDVYPAALLGRYTIDAPPIADDQIKSSADLGRSIMQADWTATDAPLPLRDFVVEGLSSQRGEIVCFDFGRELVGRVVIECDCPGEGVIDIGWSEVAENGRPLIVRKGVGYIDRIHATRGRLRFEPVQFSAMRYVALTLRGFDGPVRVRQLFVRATEPDLSWPGGFTSSDATLNAIFDLCVHSHRVGTQEAIMDCPSREQAAYVGDGMPVGRWITQLTGDDRHWRYLVREQWRRQSPQGLVRSSIFSGSNDTLIDYTLLAVVGTRDFVRYTGDIALARELIEPCRRAVAYFDGCSQAGSALCQWQLAPLKHGRVWEQAYTGTPPDFADPMSMNLFIDHPGLGWHNQNEAGIDRRGANAALNGFYVMGKRALADLEDALGHADVAARLRAEAAEIARAMHAAFYDPDRRVFVDGVLDGARLAQVSEQTNTLAVAAGCLNDEDSRELLERLLTTPDASVARCGPYFWTYLFPQLTRLGLHELALNRSRTDWGAMLAGGATALWETFLGDDLDSWCHPWSAAIQEFLQTSILGLPSVDFDEAAITLRPRFDLLAEASGSIFTRAGRFEIGWRPVGEQIEVTGHVPAGLRATLLLPDGLPADEVSGHFAVRLL